MFTNMIKIYSSENCGYCRKLKDYLDGRKIHYTVVNIDESMDNVRELKDISGQTAVPVSIIGESVIVGFDKPSIDRAINEAEL